MEEENLKLKKSNNRKKALIVILVFTLVLAGILIFVLCCGGKKEEAKPADNKQEEKQDDKKTTTPVILLEKFTNSENCESDYSMEFNNSKVEIQKDINNECQLKSVKVNGKELLDKDRGTENAKADGFYDMLNSIEFYDHYVIFFTSAQSSGADILIYNTKTEAKEYDLSIVAEDPVRYFSEYESDTKGLNIETWECSIDQCGGEKTANSKTIDDLIYKSGYQYATYRMDYVDGAFTAPKLVKEYNK